MPDYREAKEVLTNWINRAISEPGELPPATKPASWVARQFLGWWLPHVSGDLEDAEQAVSAATRELHRLGGWSDPRLGEALNEMVHAAEAMGALRATFHLN